MLKLATEVAPDVGILDRERTNPVSTTKKLTVKMAAVSRLSVLFGRTAQAGHIMFHGVKRMCRKRNSGFLTDIYVCSEIYYPFHETVEIFGAKSRACLAE